MKRCPKNKMKGQLVFEFMIAVVVFFGVVVYVLNYLNGNVSAYSADSLSESRQSKASQIGELLVLNKGNWAGGIPAVVGLSEEWPVLNYSKIMWMNASCNSDYHGFMDKLGVPYRNGLKIMVMDEQGGYLADCMWGKPVPANMAKAEAKRYGLNQTGSVLAVSVYVW